MISNTSAETPEEGKPKKRKAGHYWVRANGIDDYFIVEWTGIKWAVTDEDGHVTFCKDAHFGEIDERRIERVATLERENAELRAEVDRLKFAHDLTDASNQLLAETIKRYKDALEAVQRITKDDRPILAQIISSALSGTNE